jgi:hypothetical protein
MCDYICREKLGCANLPTLKCVATSRVHAMAANQGSISAQPTKDVDELDLISSSTLASPASKKRHVPREIARQEIKNSQRKRTLSKSALENVAVSGKKQKMQPKKVVS